MLSHFVERGPAGRMVRSALDGNDLSSHDIVRLRNGRGERIRTSDPHNPIVVRYQAALRPDRTQYETRAAMILAALAREK